MLPGFMAPLFQTPALTLAHYLLALSLGACAYFILFPKKLRWCIFVTKAKTWVRSMRKIAPRAIDTGGGLPCTTEVVALPSRKKEPKPAEPIPKSEERMAAITIYKEKLSTHYRNLGATHAEFLHCWHTEEHRLAFLEAVPESIPKRHDIKKIKNVRGPRGEEIGAWMIEKLTKVLRKKPEFNNNHWVIQLYGSLANGFAHVKEDKTCIQNSDVDCTFIMDPNAMAALDISLEKIVEVATEDPTFICSHLALTAKVPVATLKIGDNVMDITVNNHIAILNTALLREYSVMHPCIKEFVLTVKDWAKENNLTNASEGKFSSYSWTIMALVYLQAGNAVGEVLPSLQASAPAGEEFQTALEAGLLSTPSLPPIPTLFQDFLHWLAYRVKPSHVLSLREGKLITSTTKAMFIRWDVPNIEDPFELRNLNVVVSTEQAENFRNVVRKAADSMAAETERAKAALALMKGPEVTPETRLGTTQTLSAWPSSRQDDPHFITPYVPPGAEYSFMHSQLPHKMVRSGITDQDSDLRFATDMDTMMAKLEAPRIHNQRRITLSSNVDVEYHTLATQRPPPFQDYPDRPSYRKHTPGVSKTPSDDSDTATGNAARKRGSYKKVKPMVLGRPLTSSWTRPATLPAQNRSLLDRLNGAENYASFSPSTPPVYGKPPDLSTMISARRHTWSWRSSGTEVFLTRDEPTDSEMKRQDDTTQSSIGSHTDRPTVEYDSTDDDEIMVSAPVLYTA